jgi:hypothetical protein
MNDDSSTDTNSLMEYVPSFEDCDVENEFKMDSIRELSGGSWQAVIENKTDDDVVLHVGIPPLFVGEKLLIEHTSANGFTKLPMIDDDFKQWIHNLELWIVNQIVLNHDKWFGHLWSSGGLMENTPRPTENSIRQMYHSMIDEDGNLFLRVHVRHGKYVIQCLDELQNEINLEDLVNCNVIPLIEVKGVFMKSRMFNPDVVLRALVKCPIVTPDCRLFHEDESEPQAVYCDYATDDDTASESSVNVDLENIENPEEFEGLEDPKNIENTENENIVDVVTDEIANKLLENVKNAKQEAINAEDEYKRYLLAGVL